MAMRTIPESDWKKMRGVKDRAVNRFCAEALTDLKVEIEAADLTTGAHKVYRAVWKLLEDRDSALGDLFDDWRRSTAYVTLMAWARSGIMTKDEFESLSDDTKTIVRALADVRFLEE
jgi:hypothetical protein